MAERTGTVRVRGANVPMNVEPPQDEEETGGRGWGPNPRPPSQWGTPDTRGGGIGINPMPPSMWAPPVAGGSLGFGGATPSRKSALDIVNELAVQQALAEPAAQADQLTRRLAGQALPVVEEPASETFEQWLAANTGTFDESPYRNYMNFLATQDEEAMARINALYSQLAGEAEANMQRINDIYGSAQMTSGDVYGGSAQAIEDAYGSAQQQAADQMARLGIEAAAPAVINPMALSQAEAVAGIEAAGAGALDALTRYGSSSQDFGSQMAQVAQMQGVDVANQLLRDMQQRQAEAMFQMEQARANYNPYANLMQQMELENAWNQINNPQVDPRQLEAEAEFLYRQEQDDLNLLRQYYNLYYESSNGNETVTREKLLGAIEAGLLGERWRQWAAENPGVLPPLT